MFKMISYLFSYTVWYRALNDFLYNLLISPFGEVSFFKVHLLNCIIGLFVAIWVYLFIMRLVNIFKYYVESSVDFIFRK